MLQPIPTRIYRITHLDNLLATLQHGIFCRNQPTAATAIYRNTGDASLTDRRNRIAVPLPPGGFLNDYVPFYLGPRSPMLYAISHRQPQTSRLRGIIWIKFIVVRRIVIDVYLHLAAGWL